MKDSDFNLISAIGFKLSKHLAALCALMFTGGLVSGALAAVVVFEALK